MAQTFNQVQNQNAQAQPIAFNGGTNLLPGDPSPKAFPQVYDFGATGIPATGYSTTLTQLIQQANVKGIQTIFIDNTNNDGPVVITSPTFSQSLSLPAGYQGYFPILAALGSGNTFNITGVNSTKIAVVQFLNVQMPFALWPGLASPPSTGTPQPVSDAILDAIVIAGRFNTRAVMAATTDVDRSTTLAAGNVSQVLMAANPNRRGYRIQNNDPAFQADGIWVSTTGPAVIGGPSSFCLAACASIGYPGGAIDGTSTGAISVIGATAGHKIYAVEW